MKILILFYQKFFMKKNKTIIIAEIGINHNGSMKTAYELIKKAKYCGADYVKFQYFKSGNLTQKNCPLVSYQKNQSYKNQYDMLRKYEINITNLKKLKSFCRKIKLKFLISVFSFDDYIFASKYLNLNEIKIPSGEIENYELLNKLNIKKKKIFLSTGMSNLSIICNSLNVISKKKVFNIKNNQIKIINKNLHRKIKDKIILMHCISNYPVLDKNSNILALNDLSKFDLNLGYSDHTTNNVSALASYMLGARVFEKHITLSNKMKGPDHLASMNYKDFKNYVHQIKLMNSILKLKNKKIRKNEKKISKLVKKSIVAKININKGEIFTYKNLTTKRPAFGISSSKYLMYLGKKAKKNYKSNEYI
tara:strand:+ start:722 stop:1810 length:1089 start_codon:yes stop_codon:yes gene_type:complete